MADELRDKITRMTQLFDPDFGTFKELADDILDIPEIKSALNFHEACQKAFAVNGKFWVTEENVRGNYGVSASLPPAR